MRSVNSWNLTNNKLHQLFKDNNEFISIRDRGNTWEPITRWLRLDSRIFRETTSNARITLCDIESLAEIYNYRSIRWKAKKLTPIPTKVIPQSIKNIFRKIPIIKQLAYELEIVFYKYSENISAHLISIVIPARNEAGNKELLINALNKFKKIPNKLKIVAIDFGIKNSILNRLVSHGCEVLVLPSRSSLNEVLSNEPDGIFFSNGPGDPSSVSEGIYLAKSLIKYGEIPMFGICLGHQIFGLALGGSTYKLPFGHRGLNHPCGNNNQIEITSQNHGFAIDPNSLSKDIVRITHYNLNDNTVAGLEVINKPIFSVQYHPEAGPGPHDSDYLFKKFVSLMLERC